MSVLIKDMEMPKECHGCRWFYFQGTSCTEPKYYLDARCKMVESGQDWYGKDVHGGWIGESIEHIPGWTGYYQYKHCVEMGTMASQCPLCELPSAQPEQRWIPVTERLPKERDWYLGIFKESDTGWINPIPFICDYLLGKKTKATTKEGWILKECTDRKECIDYYFNLECVAWMPLPELYEERRTDE